jgi:hypothetical protein
MAKPKLNLDEALRVSAEARALSSAPIGPNDQAKVKAVLAATLDALVEHSGAVLEKKKED